MNAVKQSTEVVYVCSPDPYENMLFGSVRSLLKSGSSFDKITIFCVGKKPKAWEILDSRIQVVEVESLRQDYFMLNKIYALTREAERLIFLDSDTIIINPLDSVYQNVSEDFLGRPASYYGEGDNKSRWEKILGEYGLRNVPYFNVGFFIFQNSSHQRFLDDWRHFTEKLLLDESIPIGFQGNRVFSEQMGLSLALGASSLTYKCMEEHEHVYGWTRQEYDTNRAVVLHTGGPNFFKLVPKLEIQLGLIWDNLPKFKHYPNRIHFHRWQVILGVLRTNLGALRRKVISTLSPFAR